MDKESFQTKVDLLLELVRNKRKVDLKEAADAIQVPVSIVERWADSLKEANLLRIEYTIRGVMLEDVPRKEPSLPPLRKEAPMKGVPSDEYLNQIKKKIMKNKAPSPSEKAPPKAESELSAGIEKLKTAEKKESSLRKKLSALAKSVAFSERRVGKLLDHSIDDLLKRVKTEEDIHMLMDMTQEVDKALSNMEISGAISIPDESIKSKISDKIKQKIKKSSIADEKTENRA